MSNLLAKTARAIPYNGFLRPVCKSVTSAILFQQLEYWFDKQGDKFYKFLEPCNSSAYKEGDSWTEELAFSKDEFRTAFDNIGIRYNSKKDYDAKEDDKFDGKFYLSYHDKIRGITWYMRNAKLIESTLREMERPSLRKSEKPIYVNGESKHTQIDKVNPDYTEITTETNTKEEEPIVLTITQQLKDFAQSNNLSYEINSREDQKAQSKLVSELSITNENLLAQLQRLKPILADSKCDWWSKTNSFGFNYMLKNWGRIDSWHNANKPKVREFKKPEIKPEPVKFLESHLDTLKEFLA
jgi:hypothetical protein